MSTKCAVCGDLGNSERNFIANAVEMDWTKVDPRPRETQGWLNGMCDPCWKAFHRMFPKGGKSVAEWLKTHVLEERVRVDGPIDPVVAYDLRGQPIRESETPWRPGDAA
jgi:hypothetical protein